MYKKTILAMSVLLLVGCDFKPKNNLDGAKIMKAKCSACHNLDLPPKTFEDEKAPPMMAVAFHVADFIKVSDESARIPKAVEFVKDYVIEPSASKSFCDKESLKTYGVMPSQKGLISEDELDAVARYMFEHFTQKNLLEAQKIQRKLQQMPKGQKLAIQNNCLGCHRVDKDLVGPSFENILKRYSGDEAIIYGSIKNGSRGKYKNSKGALMPSFKKLSDEDIKSIVEWIKSR